MPDPSLAIHQGLGYRPQSDAKVALVNRNKELEELVLRTLDSLANTGLTDQRWLAIGRRHVEQGFMAINRSIFQPERVKLDGDE